MKRFKIITFGCQMNEDDSNKIKRFLLNKGLTETINKQDAEIIIINTCTVRQHAEDKALSLIGTLKKWKKNNNKLLVTGCAAERIKDILYKKFKHIDYIIGAKSYNKIFKILDQLINISSNSLKEENYDFSEYQTISKGCSMNCSYCIVPSVRGNINHIEFNQIIKDIKIKAQNGTKEITLLGQIVNSYRYEKYDFTDLLKEISNIDEIKIIRFMSPHPLFFTEKFFKEFETNKKITRHIHLPLQSASDKILKLMKRGYTYAQFKEIIKTLKSIDKTTSITTDIIVGFTSETEDDFEKSLNSIDELLFSMVYCFKYSPRFQNSYPLTISSNELKKRHQILLNKAKEVATKVIKQKLNTIESVILINKNGKGKSLSGYNCCIIDNKEYKVGDISMCKIENIINNILIVRRTT
ncbi:MAG: MiaB/RimO family radical SAM methylthiotransferase [Elusimicrobiales bacterium]|nr:MiaB/RimO family radical SAM methylthiotransferase [Elusimicrobiales bacterium]